MENTEWLNLTHTKKRILFFSPFFCVLPHSEELAEKLKKCCLLLTPFPSSFLPFPHFLCSYLNQSIMFFSCPASRPARRCQPTVVWFLCHVSVQSSMSIKSKLPLNTLLIFIVHRELFQIILVTFWPQSHQDKCPEFILVELENLSLTHGRLIFLCGALPLASLKSKALLIAQAVSQSWNTSKVPLLLDPSMIWYVSH